MDDDSMHLHARVMAMRAMMLEMAAHLYQVAAVAPEAIRAEGTDKAKAVRELDFQSVKGTESERFAAATSREIENLYADLAGIVEARSLIETDGPIKV